MRRTCFTPAVLSAAMVLSLAVVFASCGDSTSVNVAGPSISRCAVSVSATGTPIPSAGGDATVNVDAQRECTWSARSDVVWITLSSATGQGSAALKYSVAPNPNGTERRGGLVVAEQRVEIVQQPAPCRYELAPPALEVAAGGATLDVTVGTPSGCAWAVRLSDPWIAVEPPGGSGPGRVVVRVAENAGVARTATIALEGTTLSIRQAARGTPAPPNPECRYQIAPQRKTAPAGGETFTAAVTSSCAWSATSEASWIAVISGGGGAGTGTLRLQVQPNTAAARTGVVRVGTETLTVEQDAGGGGAVCSYSIKPSYYNAGHGPDDVQVTVNTAGQCSWSASSPAGWAAIAEGRNGTGPGTVRVIVDANRAEARTATLTIAGQPFALSQEGSCNATIKPTYYNAGPGPDDFKVEVKMSDKCAWTASSPVSWATVAGKSSQSGNGQVQIKVDPNPGAARAATLTIAGAALSLTQQATRR